jgi:hypothetical protein
MTAYAQKSDVYLYGLPRGALGNPGRIVDSALAADSVFTLSDHGFATGDVVYFRAPAGGTLAEPLVTATAYYAIYLTDSQFQVSTTPNGSAVTLTSDAVSMIAWTDLPFDQVLEFYSRFVDGFLPAELVPLQAPYPITVVAVVATLAAKRIQILSGMRSESMDADEAGAAMQLQRWATGVTVRDAAATQQPANTAVTTSVRNDIIGTPMYGRGPGGLWTWLGGGSRGCQ